MAISQFSDIPGYIAGWDAITSTPTVNLSTGSISSFGTDLSGAGSTFAKIGTPRWNNGAFPGFISTPSGDNTTRGGLEITLPTPVTSWYHRKFLIFVIFSPMNLIGDNTQGLGRLWGTDGTSPPSGSKYWANGAGGSNTNCGLALVGGGGSSVNTAIKNGIERQVFAHYGVSTTGSFGFVNVAASKSGNGNTNSNTFTKVTIGYLSSDATNNPYIGVIHAVHFFAYDSASAVGTQYNDTNATDGMDLGATQWSIQRSLTEMVSTCGDSIGYADGRLYDNVTNTGSLNLSTTLSSGISAGVSSLPVVASAGFTSRNSLDNGTDSAEVITVSSLPDGTHVATTVATRNSHLIAATLTNAYYGFTTPSCAALNLSKKLGVGSGVMNFNYSTPGAQLTNATANPPTDGSMHAYAAASKITAIIQRGTNDIQAAARTAAQVLTDAETYSTNAKAQTPAAGKVIVCDVIDRFDFSGGQRTISQTYNTSLRTNTNGKFDAVAKFTDHPWLTDPSNSGSITVNGATAATTVLGLIFDNVGVHPRHFGNVCMALMLDKAYADAWGVSVGYAPARPTVTVTMTAGKVVLGWTTPTSTGAPTMFGRSTDGPSCLTVYIRHNGNLLAKIAPIQISANDGSASYTTSYNTSLNPTGTFTVEVRDAANNTNGSVTAKVSGGGFISRQFARGRLSRGR